MSRKSVVFSVLGGFFITNAVLAEMIGGKIIYVGDASWKIAGLGPFLMSIGIIPWPVVFLTTDLINEYFGRRGVRRLSFLTVGLIAYVFLVLTITLPIPAAEGISGVDDASYRKVFGQSQWIIVGSLTAFLVSQLIDVFIFHLLRQRTGKALLWLRATGSTIVSQLIDSVIVLYIGLVIPLDWDMETFLRAASTNYVVKLVIAVGMTPLIYAGHWAVERYLGKSVAESLAEAAARDDLETAIPSAD
jgi:queuosine precursor transporter